MESQPHNPEIRIHPENLHPCITVFINPEDYEHNLHQTWSRFKITKFLNFKIQIFKLAVCLQNI